MQQDESNAFKSGMCERDRVNASKCKKWFVLWAISFVVAALFLGPTEGELINTPLWKIALALIPLIPGAFVIKAYLHFLSEADELIRKVHFESAANALCAVLILGVVFYLLFQVIGQWEDSYFFLWIVGYLTYARSFKRAWKKYSE